MPLAKLYISSNSSMTSASILISMTPHSYMEITKPVSPSQRIPSSMNGQNTSMSTIISSAVSLTQRRSICITNLPHRWSLIAWQRLSLDQQGTSIEKIWACITRICQMLRRVGVLRGDLSDHPSRCQSNNMYVMSVMSVTARQSPSYNYFLSFLLT
jgi:hypothetical protein